MANVVKCITGILHFAFSELCAPLPNLMQLSHIPEASEDSLKIGTNINLYLVIVAILIVMERNRSGFVYRYLGDS